MIEVVPIGLAIVLFVIALFAGVGISAIGPGGIFVTIALFLLVPITSAEVAGTASATFIATGLLATVLYRRSGDFAIGNTGELAVVLSVVSVVGALVGSWANLGLPDEIFGYVLGAFVALVGGIIIYREAVGVEPSDWIDRVSPTNRRLVVGGIGFGVGFLGGLLGVGGPVIAVPLLVILGVPMLQSLAVAQLQSIFISGFATFGYALGDAVSLPLAVLVGVPQLIGVYFGWRIAHRVEPRRLRVVLGVVLILVSPALAV